MKLPLTQGPTYTQRDLRHEDESRFDAHTIRLMNPDGIRAAEIVAYDGAGGSLSFHRQAEAEEAAEYIVRAVNCHAELVRALELIIDEYPCRLDHNGCCQTHRIGNPCEQIVAREALAKAKGAA